jgi:hypothetical protein
MSLPSHDSMLIVVFACARYNITENKCVSFISILHNKQKDKDLNLKLIAAVIRTMTAAAGPI